MPSENTITGHQYKCYQNISFSGCAYAVSETELKKLSFEHYSLFYSNFNSSEQKFHFSLIIDNT